ncbi:MAG TPA: tetratricopeptide repeat protein [Terriglobales bacterium]|nr:tetratricopeptide repeat protein [Terriglobales bacterium]
MNSFSNKPDRSRVRRTVFAVVVLLTACWSQSAERAPIAQSSSNEAGQSHFDAAQQAQKRGDYGTAEREYQAVLHDSPQFAEAHMNLGLIYQLQNRIPDAVAQFRSALKINPALTGANFFLGVDYCKTGEGAKAIPYLKAAARQESKRPDIWAWLATAQEISGDSQAEVATLKHALSLQPQNVDMLYLLGHAYERLGKKEVAALEKIAPSSSWSEQLLAESYSSSSEWTFAVIRFQNALASSPTRPGLHLGLGEVFLRTGKLDQAAQEFDKELQVDPNSLPAIVRRGEVKLIRRDIDGALEDWTRATAVDQPRTERVLGIRETGFGDTDFEQLPDPLREQLTALAPQLHARESAAAHLALAFLAVQSGNATSKEAEPALNVANNVAVRSPGTCAEDKVRKAINIGHFSAVSGCLLRVLNSQSTTEFRIQIAHALFELGGYAGSLKALSGLSDQHSPPAFYLRARCFEKLATASYLRLYQADPNSYRVHQLTGDLEAAKGHDSKAIDEYRAAVAMKPSVPNLHYSLGHLLWKDLKTAEARKEFEAELAINPRHAGALHDLGNTYLLEHQPERALPYLTQAAAIDPGDPDIHRDLGTGYAELHDYKNAETELKAAIPGDHDGSVHYKLARVYQAQGQKENATREFAISSSLNRDSHIKLEKQTERLNAIEGASPHP